jgi:transposase
MARSKTGEAIGPHRRTSSARKTLARFIERAKRDGHLDEWRRGRAVQSYVAGERVVDLAEQLDVTRGSVNRWLQWYDELGIPGLRTRIPPGVPPALSLEQQARLTALLEAGPLSAGYDSGVWTGPRIGDLIETQFGLRFHPHTVPRLLHKLGFSVQRPRKRLARADLEVQQTWLRERLPAIKKKPPPVVES